MTDAERIAELDAARARIAELESRTGYEVAAEWRDRCKAAEAWNAELTRLALGLAERILAAHEILARLAERRTNA